MSIRLQLISLYLIIIAVLISLFSISIFFQSENHRKNEFKGRLKDEAIMASTIFFNKNEISPEILKILDKNKLTSLYDEEVFIFDNNDEIVYESGEDKIAIEKTKIAEVRASREKYWKNHTKEFFGIKIKNGSQEFIIISSAIDKYGNLKQKNLLFTLFFGGLIVLLLSSLAGWFFVKRMLQPIQSIITKMDNIKSPQMGLRLELGKSNDEFTQLSIRFNRMLDRLQHAFLEQKAFVSHASHELRTPLTSITGQIQVSLLADDDPDELKKMIKSILEDVQNLNMLSNNLLDLSSLNAENQNHSFSLINVIDKLSRVRNEILKKQPNANINLHFEEENDEIPELLAIPSLAYTAFLNIIENGVKYATDKTLDIWVTNSKKEITIAFQNKTLEINESDLNKIFEPFRRGPNSKNKSGHGVGLPLVKGILELHDGKIEVKMISNFEILFLVTLPK
jgi:signal transduction histidine kinase